MHQTWRACLSGLLIFALLAMVPVRAAMPLAMASGHMLHMHDSHGAADVQQYLAMDHHMMSHSGHQQQCSCGAHCCLCGVCHSSLPTISLPDLLFAVRVTPNAPQRISLAKVLFPPDPRPPRA